MAVKSFLSNYLFDSLKLIDEHIPVALLLRHSIREELPSGESGFHVPLTSEGYELATQLGRLLGARLSSINTSPVPRCLETARALQEGAGTNYPIRQDKLLGDPGVFVQDSNIAWKNWIDLGNSGVIKHLISGVKPLPGMVDSVIASRRLVNHMLNLLAKKPGIHIFISHDSIIAGIIARFMNLDIPEVDWPDFLDGALFWEKEGNVQMVYKNYSYELKW
ncbi:MAG: histidine phosphatase family protein [Fibrobacter sp.]|jgi:broad specificity phosphatase PhoE|nr:histidine phosphatase family protein [Fibrobacter sp.]